MQKRGKKHYCWGLCNSDSRYVDWFREYIFPVLKGIFSTICQSRASKRQHDKLAKRTIETEDRKSETSVTSLW